MMTMMMTSLMISLMNNKKVLVLKIDRSFQCKILNLVGEFVKFAYFFLDKFLKFLILHVYNSMLDLSRVNTDSI